MADAATLSRDLVQAGDALSRIASPAQSATAALGKLALSVDAATTSVSSLAKGALVEVADRLKAFGTVALDSARRATGVALDVVTEVVKSGAAFERQRLMLERLGGTAKGADLNQVLAFSASTPFDPAKLVDAFIALKSEGLKPLNDGTLKAVGDAAAAVGSDPVTMAAAFTDALGGDFKALVKEIGGDARAEGSRIVYSFVDQDGKERKLSAGKDDGDALRAMLGTAFDARGFTGGMDKLGGSWDGMIARLNGQVAVFYTMIADAGVFDFLKSKLQSVLAVVEQWSRDGTLRAWAQRLSDGFVAAFTAIEELVRRIDWDALTRDFAAIDWKRIIGDVVPAVRAVADGVSWLVTVLGGAQNTVIAITGLLGLHAIAPLVGLVTEIWSLGGLLARGLALLFTPFGAVAAAVAAAVIAVVYFWDDIRAAFAAAWAWIEPLGADITALGEGIWGGLTGGVQDAAALLDGGLARMSDLLSWLRGLFDGFSLDGAWAGISATVDGWLQDIDLGAAGLALVRTLVDGARAGLDKTGEVLAGLGGAVAEGASGAAAVVADLAASAVDAVGGIDLGGAGTELVNTLIEGAQAGAARTGEVLAGVGGAVVNGMSGATSVAGDLAASVADVVGGVDLAEAWGGLTGTIGGLFDGTGLGAAASELATGLAEGAQAGLAKAGEALSGLGDMLLGGAGTAGTFVVDRGSGMLAALTLGTGDKDPGGEPDDDACRCVPAMVAAISLALAPTAVSQVAAMPASFGGPGFVTPPPDQTAAGATTGLALAAAPFGMAGPAAGAGTIEAPVTVSITVNGVAELSVFRQEAEAAVRQALAEWQGRQQSTVAASLYDDQ